ncbi:MAG: VOC family protein [Rhodospirillum sp.]|nr:VOC family protein [Rhodospirillum sp.]MCF8490125.1 VOC family protein [Rhodospirillum sp.]MCF8501588.1 VOC family protein [Rhodospirillum sp.]
MTATVPQHLHLVTLAVADISRARAFYDALGWTAHGDSNPHVVFYQTGGMVLGLYGRDALAADLDRPSLGEPGAVTLALNLGTKEDVAPMVERWLAAGATRLTPIKETPWGALMAYVADPDGHPWEIGCVPSFLPDDAGNLILP